MDRSPGRPSRPDSHVNAYIRLRTALTEEQPTIKPYEENLWAQLPDAKTGPIEMSLMLLDRAARPLGAVVAGAEAPTITGAFLSIRSMARARWNGCCSSTPGMAVTTPRTSRSCASSVSGK
jgi:hypothetical protein